MLCEDIKNGNIWNIRVIYLFTCVVCWFLFFFSRNIAKGNPRKLWVSFHRDVIRWAFHVKRLIVIYIYIYTKSLSCRICLNMIILWLKTAIQKPVKDIYLLGEENKNKVPWEMLLIPSPLWTILQIVQSVKILLLYFLLFLSLSKKKKFVTY